MRRGGKIAALPKGHLSTASVARLSGLNHMTLRRWSARGALRPGFIGAGRGGLYVWSLRDVLAARAIAKLRERRSAQQVKRVVRALERYGEDLAGAALVEDAHGVYRVLDSGDLLGLLDGGQVRAVALAPIVEAIRAEAHRAGIAIDLGELRARRSA
jgi:DNA-binding transcriptional MerR regulator